MSHPEGTGLRFKIGDWVQTPFGQEEVYQVWPLMDMPYVCGWPWTEERHRWQDKDLEKIR